MPPPAAHVLAPWDTPAVARTHWRAVDARAPRPSSVAMPSRAFALPPQPDSFAPEHSPSLAARVLARGRNSLPFGKTAPRRVSYGGPIPSCLVGRQRPGSSELSSLLCPSVSAHPRRASPAWLASLCPSL